jgi:DNA-binding NarL/FixJ family response regulator
MLNNMKSILIIEDHPFVAEATKALFMTKPNVKSVDIAKNSDEAILKLNDTSVN